MSLAQRVLAELPQDAPFHLVLDGARDSRIRGFVYDTRAPRWCLYRGRLTPELEDAAPWLLSLTRDHPATELFFKRFWGQSCGILLSTAMPGNLLRRHLRRFLLARTRDGRTLLFRYYDPRVLRVYLPTLTAGEAAQFFGSVSTFIAEAEEPRAFHVFRRTGQQMEDRLIAASFSSRSRPAG
jgi:hypothetical protein